jgi:hypothetical protein
MVSLHSSHKELAAVTRHMVKAYPTLHPSGSRWTHPIAVSFSALIEFGIFNRSYSLTSPSPCPLPQWGRGQGEGGYTCNRSIT